MKNVTLALFLFFLLVACATDSPATTVTAEAAVMKTAVFTTIPAAPATASPIIVPTLTPTTIPPTALPTLTPAPSATALPTITPTATPAIIDGNFNTLTALELMHSDHNVVYSDDLGEQTHGLVTLENHERNIGIQSGSGTPCDTLASQLDELPFPCLSIVLIEHFVKNETNQTLLVTQIADYDCHMCSAWVQGAIFQETPDGWIMRLNSKIPVYGGIYGRSPRAELVQMGIEQFVIVFRDNDMQMGEYTSADTLFIEDETGWKEILSIITSHGHDGANEFNEEWGFRSESEFVTGEHAPYFDYLVTTSGTKYFFAEDGVWDLRTFTEERRYIFRDDEYVLEE